MLAAPHGPLGPGRWRLERKYDGHRLIAVRRDGMLRFHSRSGRDVTHRFGHLASGMPGQDGVWDGEAVAMRAGKDDFSAVARGEATHYVIFDVLVDGGRDVRGLALEVRLALLAAMPVAPPCARSPGVEGDPERMRLKACQKGWEGLVAKRFGTPYVAGRTDWWRKLKCVLGQEFVIGGFTPGNGSRSHFGALLVGYYDGRKLRYAGKVGTGFDEATRAGLARLMAARLRPTSPFSDPAPTATWVDPRLVARVDFTQWTPDGKLRHPRFIALREDKPPEEVVREP